MPFTEPQMLIVKATFRKLVPVSQKTVSAFYNRLFELDPAARLLFKGDMTEQVRRFIQMLAVIVSGLEHFEDIAPAMAHLGKRHITYGINKEQYTTVGEALLWSIAQTLGAEFTPEVRDAWQAVYDTLADAAIKGGYPT